MIFVFPGQGSQKIGMGKDIYDAFASARDVFHEVDDAISFKLSDLIFSGTNEDLKATENSQPALFAVSMAFVKTLQNEFGVNIFDKIKYVAGHSLGEYTALCCAEVLSISDAAKVLRTRGKEMAKAFPNDGGMAAVLGLSFDDVAKLVSTHSNDPASSDFLQVANDNCEGQIVVSGHKNAIELIMKEAPAAGAKKAVKLEVSGPFHSKLMKPAVKPLEEVLDSVTFSSPKKPVISNVTAKAENENLKELLLEQIVSPVRWRESINYAEQNGVTKCVEIGNGKVLTNLVKKISGLETFNINSAETLEEFCK